MFHALTEAYRTPAAAEAYSRRHRQSWTRRAVTRREARLVSNLLDGLPRSARLLDAACGLGRIASPLRLKGWSFLSMDLSRNMLVRGVGEGNLESNGSVVGSVFCLPLKRKTMDGCICIRFLHHLREEAHRVTVLRELGRVVDGPIVVSLWSRFDYQSLRRWIKQRLGRRPSARHPVSLDALKREAEAAGLEVRRICFLYRLVSETLYVLLIPKETDSANPE